MTLINLDIFFVKTVLKLIINSLRLLIGRQNNMIFTAYRRKFWWAVLLRLKNYHPPNSFSSLEGFFCVGLKLPQRCVLEAADICLHSLSLAER